MIWEMRQIKAGNYPNCAFANSRLIAKLENTTESHFDESYVRYTINSTGWACTSVIGQHELVNLRGPYSS